MISAIIFKSHKTCFVCIVKPVYKGHTRVRQNNGLYRQVVFILRSICLILLVKKISKNGFYVQGSLYSEVVFKHRFDCICYGDIFPITMSGSWYIFQVSVNGISDYVTFLIHCNLSSVCYRLALELLLSETWHFCQCYLKNWTHSEKNGTILRSLFSFFEILVDIASVICCVLTGKHIGCPCLYFILREFI